MQRNDLTSTPPTPNAASTSYTTLSNAASATATFISSVATTSAPYLHSATASIASVATSAASSAYAYLVPPATPTTHASSSSSSMSALPTPVSSPIPTGAKPKKPVRDRTTYERNVTAALALPDTPPKPKISTHSIFSRFFSVPTEIAKQPPIRDQIKALQTQRLQLPKDDLTSADKQLLDKLTLEKIELLHEQIIEHAARRVDLFFYACVAVYGTHVAIEDGPTIEQHGIGSNEHGTHACHSALFSNLQIEKILKTHIMRTSNMTVELPAEVNDFDKHIERSGFVANMIVILKNVSNAKLNPKEAMTEFLKNIHYCFEKFRDKYLYDDNILNKPKATVDSEKIRTQLQSYRRIWELQNTGTFKAAVQGQEVKEVDPNYIYCMLRVNSFAQRNFHFLNTHFLKMQQEILGEESTFTLSNKP